MPCKPLKKGQSDILFKLKVIRPFVNEGLEWAKSASNDEKFVGLLMADCADFEWQLTGSKNADILKSIINFGCQKKLKALTSL